MNILIVSQVGRNSKTGVRTYCINLQEEYRRLGHHVIIVTPDDAPYVLMVILKLLRRLYKFLFRSDYSLLILDEVYSFVSIFFAVRKKNRQWDIIHGQEVSSSNSARLALGGTVPVITTCHYNETPITELKWTHKLSEKQVKKIEKWFKYHFAKCSNYIFVSDYVFRKSNSLLKTAIRKEIIYNGVSFPIDAFPKPSSDVFIISNVGSMEARKNQILLINAACILAKTGLNFKIWFFGDGPKREEWLEVVRQNGLEGYIVFWGHQKEWLKVAANSDIYVHTALNENCSFSIVEAFSIGLPVLALNTGGIPEQFPRSGIGLLAEDINPNDLAETITRYADGEVRKETQLAQYANSAKFSVTEMAKQTVAFYEKIITGEESCNIHLNQYESEIV